MIIVHEGEPYRVNISGDDIWIDDQHGARVQHVPLIVSLLAYCKENMK